MNALAQHFAVAFLDLHLKGFGAGVSTGLAALRPEDAKGLKFESLRPIEAP